MPNLALLSALSAVALSRQSRFDRVTQSLIDQDNQQEFVLTYAGFQNGQHLGTMPNGGYVPVQPTSNGAIGQGDLFTAQTGTAGKLFGYWMPN